MNAFFLPSTHGALFAQLYQPESPWTQAIIHCPAFAEEMNKSRALVAKQARAWAALGYAVLVFDPYGTGDSQGEFAEATWQCWQDDLHHAVQWLTAEGAQQVHLWGLRLGCLTALDFIAQRSHTVSSLIAWQPVLNGDTFVTQFLRLRVAAALFDANTPAEKVSDLKQLLQNGQTLEVAGYALNPQLIQPITALRAHQCDIAHLTKMALFEVVNQADTPPSLPLQNWLQTLSQQSVEVQFERIEAPPFWSSQEIATAPNLIAASTACIEQWRQHAN